MTPTRRLLAVLVAVTLAVLAAPASADPGKGNGVAATLATSYAGQVRTFNFYVAPHVPTRTPVPLLIVLHGLYLDPASAEASTGLDAVADNEDVAVAYPSGYGGGWNAGNCCGDAHAARIDDVGFLVHIVDLVRQIRPIDVDRIYLAGFSNGGMMALKAECDRPDVFAGAVSVSGTLQAPCSGRQPVNTLLIHGQRDTTVPYAGERLSKFLGVPVTPVPTSAARLASRSGCTVKHTIASPLTTRTVYDGCAEGTSVQLLTVPALGHRWPSVERDRVDGGALAWTFLQAQRRLS